MCGKKERRDAVEMRQSLTIGQMTIIDWERHILQNNLYGVDLNAESVEITTEIMANGGFDIVIGNPPYGANLTQA